VLSGISLDGKSFFYVNPLEVWPEACSVRNDLRHVKTIRQGWFSCACCPPNVARLLASLPHYVYSYTSDTAYVHLYVASEVDLPLGKAKVTLIQETDYPWQEGVNITVQPEKASEFTLALRIPGWCQEASMSVNGQPIDLASITTKGYAYIRRVWQPEDRLQLILPMPISRVRANPKVRENAGRVALQRGPIVYCLEEVDNGSNLSGIILPPEAKLIAEWKPKLLDGIMVITGKALRIDESQWEGNLYSIASSLPTTEAIEITAVPYSTWCNREPGEMLVWIREA
jgi:DUF1680 family protein